MSTKTPVRKRGCKCPTKKCTCGATWSYRLDLGPDPKTGKRRQTEKGGFRTKPEAEAAWAKAFTEVSEGTYVAEKNVLFKDFAKQWIEMYASTGKVRSSTVDIRRDKLKNILAYFSQIQVRQITRKMYQDMLNDLKVKEYAAKTISSIQECGKLLFKKAMELEIITSDPTEYSMLPSFQQTVEELEEEVELPKYLEKEELAKFLETCKKFGRSRDYVIFYALAYTGMRVGEICALNWRSIDSVNHTFLINKTIYNPGGVEDYELHPPKTKKSKRTIDVDPAVISELEIHKAQQNKVKMNKRNIWHDKDFVFAREKTFPGYPETIVYVERRMKRYLKLAGLNTVLTPHSLRHTHTSLMAEAGATLEEIMERLGHANDRVTKEVYLHVTKARKKDTSHKFSELMKSIR